MAGLNIFQKAVARVTGIPISLTGGNELYFEEMRARTATGETVNSGTVMHLAAAWACVGTLSSTVGSTPLGIYRSEGKTSVIENGHEHSMMLSSSPNASHTPFEFWEYAQASLELEGNAYGYKQRGVMGNVIGLEPLDPRGVSVTRIGGEVRYSWLDVKTKITRTEPAENVLHIRARLESAGSLKGMSTLAACSSVFGLAQATNRSAGSMFKNGARPSGILSTDMPMTAEQRKETEALLQAKFQGAMNAHRPMLLDNKLAWQSLSFSAHDSQMIESRRFSVEEICLIYGVPPHIIGYTKVQSPAKGLTEQTHGFHKFGLRPRYKRIEESLERDLLTPAERAQGLHIRFNLEALLRGVTSERSAFYESGLRNGYMTINEVRALEKLPPVDGGDVPRMQAQNIPIVEATGANIGSGGIGDVAITDDGY